MTVQTMTKVSFSINSDQLKVIKKAINGLKHTSKLAAFDAVKLIVGNEKIVFEAQDLTNYVKMEFESYNNSQGELLLDKKVLKDLKLKKNEVANFKSDNNSSFKLSLNGLTMTYNQSLEFESNYHEKDFAEITYYTNKEYTESIKNSLKFVSNQETRPILMGICHDEGDVFCTNSHQMYHNNNVHDLEDKKITISSTTGKLVSDLITSKDNLIFKLSKENEHKETKYIKYEADGIEITGKLLDGNFPIIKNMFPDYFKTEIKLKNVEINQFIDTIKTMISQSIDGKNNIINLIKNDKQVKLFSYINGTDQKVEQVFENLTVSGEDLKISFNGKNLLNGLEQQKKNSQITLQFTGDMSPFQIITDTDEKYLYSPVRTY